VLRIAEAVELTDTGRQREANEDSLFARAPLFAVADGMGGAQAGEVASRIAVDCFGEVTDPDALDGPPAEQLLRDTALSANRKIFELAQGDSSQSGMGTTLTAALLRGDELSIGHVGDSRAYVYRDGELKQITNDHSLVEELRRQGKLTRDQAAEHPQRSVITRALGPEPKVEVDTMTFRAKPGDVYLLCSDGLTTMLADEDLLAIFGRGWDLDRTARRLVKAANDRGGRDNITVVMFRVESAGVGEGAEPGTEASTLIGASAEEAGWTADAVRAGAKSRPARAPAHAATTGSASRWPRRILKGAIALFVVAAIVFGAIIGARQVWFLGTDEGGRITLYRGLPYDLPFGISLYSENESVPITLSALPEDRREVVTDHELRSRDDAVSLVEDLQRAAVGTTVEEAGANAGGGGSPSGNGETTVPEKTTPGGSGGGDSTVTAPETTTPNGGAAGGSP